LAPSTVQLLPLIKEKFERLLIHGLPKAMLALNGIGEIEEFDVRFRERGMDVDLVGAFLTGLKEQLPTLIQLNRELEAEFKELLGVMTGRKMSESYGDIQKRS
jgi:hypothetical protein